MLRADIVGNSHDVRPRQPVQRSQERLVRFPERLSKGLAREHNRCVTLGHPGDTHDKLLDDLVSLRRVMEVALVQLA